jgi:hypothetical protein
MSDLLSAFLDALMMTDGKRWWHWLVSALALVGLGAILCVFFC